MRHGHGHRKLNRTSEHRKAMFQNMIKSLNEIKEVISGMSLYLGIEIPNWPPENISELSKKLEDEYK